MAFHITEPESAPDSAEEIGIVRGLFVEYQAELDEDLCFQGWDDELRTLPGKYARPAGRLFVARDAAGTPAGCIAMRPLGPAGECEMKRLYVRPEARGTGLGAKLIDLLIAEAGIAGYSVMRLDSLPRLAPAIRLYESRGFTRTDRYNNDPDPETVFMSLELG